MKSIAHSPSSDDPRSCPRRRPCSPRSRWRQQPSDAYRKWARGSPPSGPRPQEACSRPDRRNPRRSFAVSVIKRGKRNRRLVGLVRFRSSGWKLREFQPLTNYRIPGQTFTEMCTNEFGEGIYENWAQLEYLEMLEFDNFNSKFPKYLKRKNMEILKFRDIHGMFWNLTIKKYLNLTIWMYPKLSDIVDSNVKVWNVIAHDNSL